MMQPVSWEFKPNRAFLFPPSLPARLPWWVIRGSIPLLSNNQSQITVGFDR
jgi:hypothetical protein